MIPGSAKRAAFEDALNTFLKLMEKAEATLKKIPDFTAVSLSFVPPGEELADSARDDIPTCNGPSSPQHIVLGTVSLGVRCLFQDRVRGINEQRPRTLLTAKVIMEEDLRSIMGVQEEQKPTLLSGQERGDGRDP